MEPKTWSDKEIIDLMEKEAGEYYNDCRANGLKSSFREMLECVLDKMKEHGLIEDTP